MADMMDKAIKNGASADEAEAMAIEQRLLCAFGRCGSVAVWCDAGLNRSGPWTWQRTAQLAGCVPSTHIHGVGDGALWIVNGFEHPFGPQGRYTIDFFQVSESLAAAAPHVAP